MTEKQLREQAAEINPHLAEDEHERQIRELMDLDLEYRLTVGMRMAAGNCPCAQYLIQRREVLIPVTLRKAEELNADPSELFHKFQNGLHNNHDQINNKL